MTHPAPPQGSPARGFRLYPSMLAAIRCNRSVPKPAYGHWGGRRHRWWSAQRTERSPWRPPSSQTLRGASHAPPRAAPSRARRNSHSRAHTLARHNRSPNVTPPLCPLLLCRVREISRREQRCHGCRCCCFSRGRGVKPWTLPSRVRCGSSGVAARH